MGLARVRCGADSLLLLWDKLLLMVGPYGDSVKYETAAAPLLHTEADGVRIISATQTELLQVRRDRGPHTISASFTYDGGHFYI